jgi:cytochrome P450 PksS
MRFLQALGELVRWREWCDSKFPLFLACLCYAALRSAHGGLALLADMAALAVLFCLYASYGHLVNDYSDLEADKAAGKRRRLATWNARAARGAIAGSAAATALLAAACFDTGTVALTVGALGLAAAYSLPPLRLKQRSWLGWIAAALAQRTLPLAFAFQGLGAWDLGAAMLCLLGTLIGLRFIAVHQLYDRRHDLRTGVATAATVWSRAKVVLLAERGLLPLEAILTTAVAAALAPVAPLATLAWAAYAARQLASHSTGRQLFVASYQPFDDFYSLLLPLALAATLALHDPYAVAAFLLVSALRYRRIAAIVRRQPVAAAAGAPPPARLFSKADPYPYYARLRAAARIYWFTPKNFPPLWLVVRHADALTVFKDARFLKNRPGAPPTRGFGTDMLESDPPAHTRLRGLVGKSLTPRLVERLRGRIAELANGLLDQAAPRGGIDVITEYGAEVPLIVICELLGVPIADRARFRAFAYQHSLSHGRRLPPAPQRAKERFTQQLSALIEARRRQPRDDLLSALVRAEQDGERLSADELVAMIYLLLVAGYMTTVNFVGNATLALLRHPEQLELLRRKPDLMDFAIEELLRFESPLEMSTAYYAGEDVHFGTGRIERGACVRVCITSANRDEEQFPRPDALDLTRDAHRHLAFGQGIHYCVGAPLARLEGRILLETLLARAPALRLAVPAEQVAWRNHPVLRGLLRLPVHF